MADTASNAGWKTVFNKNILATKDHEMWIYAEEEWKKCIPWIYHDDDWCKCDVYIYSE